MHFSFRSLRLAAAFAAVILGFSVSAHASPIPFNIQIQALGDNTEFTGTISENLVTMQATGSFVYFDGVNSYTFLASDFANDTNTSTDADHNYSSDVVVNSNGDTLNLLFNPDETATGPFAFTELFCSVAAPCEAFSSPVSSSVVPFEGSALNISDGYVQFTYVPLASTPEPSSFVLLGTGALSLAGAARRKFIKA